MPLPTEIVEGSKYLRPRDIPLTNTNGYYYLRDYYAERNARQPKNRQEREMPFYQHGISFVFAYFDDVHGRLYVWYCHT